MPPHERKRPPGQGGRSVVTVGAKLGKLASDIERGFDSRGEIIVPAEWARRVDTVRRGLRTAYDVVSRHGTPAQRGQILQALNCLRGLA